MSNILQAKLVSIVVIIETMEIPPKLAELIKNVKSTAPVFAINIAFKESKSFFAVFMLPISFLQNKSVRVIIPRDEKKDNCAEISSTLYGDNTQTIISEVNSDE